jgi:hypothetical protein
MNANQRGSEKEMEWAPALGIIVIFGIRTYSFRNQDPRAFRNHYSNKKAEHNVLRLLALES